MMLKLKLQYFGLLMWSWLIGKDSDAGRDQGQEEKGTAEDEMAGWHHWLDGRESEWTPGVGDGQGGLAHCDSWGGKESDTTERLNWTEQCPAPRARPNFSHPNPSHLEAYTSLLSSSIRGQTEEARRTTVPQWLKLKPPHRKLIRMQRPKAMCQREGQNKTPEKQLNEVEIGNLPERELEQW